MLALRKTLNNKYFGFEDWEGGGGVNEKGAGKLAYLNHNF
jgi:hypothetical protein